MLQVDYTIDEGLERKLKLLSTPEIADALDVASVRGTAHGIRPVTDGLRFYGRAFTVRYLPADIVPGTVGDYIDDVPAGSVIVLDNQGRTDCTVWGGILSNIAANKKIAGSVINGVCRDVDVAISRKYPLFSRGRYMRTGKDRVQVEAYNEAVSLGKVRVIPGDIIVGDENGVVVVPRAVEREIIESAFSTREKEEKIADTVRKGTRLDEARKEYNYHTLQRTRRA